ncbi:MAG: hypothetical protein AAB675_02100, partial [Patescibacteria group bacterium]
TVVDPSAGSGQAATGLFFNKLSAASLAGAIKKFEKSKFDSNELIKHAQKFSKDRFKKEIKEFVSKVYAQHT